MTADLGALLRACSARLAAAGVADPRGDAERLAAHVLGLSRGELAALALRGGGIPEPEQVRRLEQLLGQRADRVPLQHLTGRAGFRRLELRVGPGVFVPRPETEVVAGLAIAEAGTLERPLVVDLCTGSGAIAFAVADEVPAARVVALELDPHALAWAEANLAELDLAGGPAGDRVELRAGSVVDAGTGPLADLAGQVDVVVANPPYIPPGATPVDPEVRDHDPEPALYGGGPDGLALPRAVVTAAAVLLRPPAPDRPGGLLVMEHAETQAAAARALVDGPGWEPARTVPDLTGRPRALVARRRSG